MAPPLISCLFYGFGGSPDPDIYSNSVQGPHPVVVRGNFPLRTGFWRPRGPKTGTRKPESNRSLWGAEIKGGLRSSEEEGPAAARLA